MTHGVRLVIEHALADAFPQAVLDRGPPNGSIIIKDERGDRYTVSVQPVLAGSVDAQIADKLGVTNDPLGLEQFARVIGILPEHPPAQQLAAANPDVRTDRILDALFGGCTVTGRYASAMRQQIPNPKKQGIGVDEADYKNGGLP